MLYVSSNFARKKPLPNYFLYYSAAQVFVQEGGKTFFTTKTQRKKVKSWELKAKSLFWFSWCLRRNF